MCLRIITLLVFYHCWIVNFPIRWLLGDRYFCYYFYLSGIELHDTHAIVIYTVWLGSSLLIVSIFFNSFRSSCLSAAVPRCDLLKLSFCKLFLCRLQTTPISSLQCHVWERFSSFLFKRTMDLVNSITAAYGSRSAPDTPSFWRSVFLLLSSMVFEFVCNLFSRTISALGFRLDVFSLFPIIPCVSFSSGSSVISWCQHIVYSLSGFEEPPFLVGYSTWLLSFSQELSVCQKTSI